MKRLLFLALCVAALGSGCATSRTNTERRAREVIIPELRFKEARIYAVADFLREMAIVQCRDGDAKGVNIIIVSQDDDRLATRVTMTARCLSLYDALAYVAECSGLAVRYDRNAIVLCDAPEPEWEVESWPYDGELHEQIRGADRLVVRDGCHACCDPREKWESQEVYFSVTNADDVAEVILHLRFDDEVFPNTCGCCGHPALDWYAGTGHLARITWKHNYGFMMEDGSVATLKPRHRRWLRKWLLGNGLTEKEIR